MGTKEADTQTQNIKAKTTGGILNSCYIFWGRTKTAGVELQWATVR